MKRVAVVILNWNGKELLDRFLPSVIRTTNRSLAEIIVVDNGSTDGSIEFLHHEFPKVRLIPFNKNYGFAEGYNRALSVLTNEYAVLLNSDVATTENWLDPLVSFLDKNPKVAAVQPKILSYRNPGSFEHAGAAGGYLDKNGYPYCRGRVFDDVETDRGQYDNPTEIFWASGAALTIRRELYIEAGGLDPKFFAHMEEIDLCWRLKLMGYKIFAVPESKVYHLGGGSLNYNNPRKTYLNFRNNLLMLHKNLPDYSRWHKLFKRRLLDTLAWGKYVATFDFRNAGAVWKAHRDFAKMKKEYRTHPKIDLLDSMIPRRNIIVDHFLKRNTPK